MLNCNVHDVALHAAAELGADKLIFCHNDDEVAALNLPAWLPLSDAQDMLLSRMEVGVGKVWTCRVHTLQAGCHLCKHPARSGPHA